MGARVGRGRVSLLLASSSVAALVLGGGSSPAVAACPTSFTNTTAPGCTNAATITGIAINNSTITSTITNSGTISPNGIVLTNASTVVGGIAQGFSNSNSTINGGITIDSTSKMTGSGHTAVAINAGNFTGGIANAGTIAAGASAADIAVGIVFNVPGFHDVQLNIPTFAGGISNSGTLMGARYGVLVGGEVNGTPDAAINLTISSFAGGITNTGTISANTVGIIVGGRAVGGGQNTVAKVTLSRFSGTVSNNGSISALEGIVIGGSGKGSITNGSVVISTFAGDVINSGTISAGAHGIVVGIGGLPSTGNDTSAGVIVISTFAGAVRNSGTISAGSGGIVIGGKVRRGSLTIATFTNGVTNSGMIVSGALGVAVGGNPTLSGDLSIGTFAGGIVNQAGGSITATGIGIAVGGTPGRLGVITISAFSGGIDNAGTVSAANGIVVGGVNPAAATLTSLTISTFAGGVTNSGAISAGQNGILVGGLSQAKGAPDSIATFSGGIANAGSGTITAGNAAIEVGGLAQGASTFIQVSAFSGGITNAGLLSAGTGILLGGAAHAGSVGIVISTFAGGIANAGMIAATNGAGIRVGGTASGTALLAISTFAGGITNTGTISGGGTNPVAVQLDHIGSFSGDIVNAAGASMAGAVNVGTGAGLVLGAARFSGNITNAGRISANTTNILITHVSTFTGNIVNSGTLTGANGFGILVEFASTSGTFAGAITNSGSITQDNGIRVDNAGVFGTSGAGGGILNTGTIAASGAHGIEVVNDATFLGGITNAGSGTITAASIAIQVAHVSTFAGGLSNAGAISNAGVISGGNFGILVTGGVGFAPGSAIVNTGTISGGFAAIDVKQATSAVTIDQAGVINGDINLSTAGNADVVNVTGGTINGNVVGAGSADTINFTLASGTFTYGPGFGFTGINQVNVNSGTVILDGANQATNIAIKGGLLQVGDAANLGASLTGAVDVIGGTLSGHGNVIGSVFVENGGTLAPGGSIGTLTIVGPLTFQPGSTYAVQIAPGAGNRSSTAVVGNVVINGGTVTVTPQAGSYSATEYVIVSTTGGRSGTFTHLVVNNFTGTMTLDYTTIPGDVLLDVSAGNAIQGPLPSPGNLSVDQQNVLNAINAFIKGGNTLPPGIQGLFSLSGSALANALTHLEGENNAGFFQGAFQAGNSFLNLMVNPFLDGRFGNGGGFGAAMGFADDEPPALPQAALAFASAMPVKAQPAATFEQRFSIWGAAYGGSGRVLGDADVLGTHTTKATAAAFAAGIDYRLSPDTIVGIALAGGGTGWNVDANLGSGSSDMFQAGVYASHHWGAAYLSGAVAYNFHDVTTDRTLTIAGTDKLEARFQANGVGARIEGGWRFATPWLGFTPYAAAQVQSIALPNYAENATAGSNQFALNVAAQTATTTRTELGAWLDRKLLLQNGALLTLYGRAAWAHDEGNSPSASAIFQALPGANFIVNGAVPARDGALVTGAAQYSLASGWAFLAKFDGEFSSTTSIYAGSGMVKKTW
jgi:uncharacterized protein with beta-barrel porin domain